MRRPLFSLVLFVLPSPLDIPSERPRTAKSVPRDPAAIDAADDLAQIVLRLTFQPKR